MAPFDLPAVLGPLGAHAVEFAIGAAFGTVLELSGFGNSMKLSGQFYFRDLTVLKVMFTAIVVAMVLIFAASAGGLLDYELVWVNPTYLWPGIVGGLIMGAGFIIGGFCPGTSLVAAATLKLDGVVFLGGVLLGVFAFGETVAWFDGFWHSSALGRVTIFDWLGVPAGVVVLGVVLMALGMFWGGEKLEAIFGDPARRPGRRVRRYRLAGAAVLVAGAALVLGAGQPTVADRWRRVAAVEGGRLEQRKVQIEPGELLSLREDDGIKLVLLDVRSESDYNLFHLEDAVLVSADKVAGLTRGLLAEPAQFVVVLMSNDELSATRAWQALAAEKVPNTYLLAGGINGWLDMFAPQPAGAGDTEPDMLRHHFDRAWGSSHPAATPVLAEGDVRLQFAPRVVLQAKRTVKKGGCG